MKSVCLVLVLSLSLIAQAQRPDDRHNVDNPVAAEAMRQMERRRLQDMERRRALARLAMQRELVRQQLQENAVWYDEAVAAEATLVNRAEDLYARREFSKAKAQYRAALDVRFEQWVFTESSEVTIRTETLRQEEKVTLPALVKRRFELATSNTQIAVTRLLTIDMLIQEQDLAAIMISAAKAAALERFVEAHDLYRQAVAVARLITDSEFAATCAEEAAEKSAEILNTASALLDAAAAGLQDGATDRAVDAMDQFKETYGGFAQRLPLSKRVAALEAIPAVKSERTERAALEKEALAETALARQDYKSALTWYDWVIRAYPDSQTAARAKVAAEKLRADPAVTAAIRAREAQLICTVLLANGDALAEKGEVEEAAKFYQKVIADYPDTTYAEEAKKGLARLAARAPAQ